MGKIHLTSAMNERDTMAEIRSVFSKAMKDDPCFEFSILHPIGGGSKSLTVPKTSASFVWSAKEVCKVAGRGSIYILAKADLAEEPELGNLSDHGSTENIS